MKKRVIIYARVSTHSQGNERQVEELEQYSREKGFEVVKIFSETISGLKKLDDRTEINQLLDFVKREPVDGVLVWELSRLGRRTKDVLSVVEELTSRKIWVDSNKGRLITLNEDGTENKDAKFNLTILSGVASLERETIISRSISGMRKSVNDGNWLGGKFLPYGYKREGKKLVVEEEESEVIKLIFHLYLQGNGTKRIANELNRRKIPTRYNKSVNRPIVINQIAKDGGDFTWKDGTIYGILTNLTYIGKKEGVGLIKGLKLNSPPIISEEDFLQVKEKLKSTQRRKTKKFFYLFDKKLVCGICGRSYHPHKRENNKDNRYICLSKRYGESCENFGISIPKLHDAVWSLLRHNPNEIKKILTDNNSNDGIDEEIKLLEEIKNKLQEEVVVIERKEKNLIDTLLDDKIDRNIYNKIYLKLSEEKRKVKEELGQSLEELNFKKNQREKQNNANYQLRGIKDNKAVLKKVVNNVIIKVLIHPIKHHNLDKTIMINKQDKYLFIEVFTFLNSKTPLCFIISQRSEIMILPNPMEYDKTTKTLEIGKGKINFVEEEEEEQELVVREIFHLKSLE